MNKLRMACFVFGILFLNFSALAQDWQINKDWVLAGGSKYLLDDSATICWKLNKPGPILYASGEDTRDNTLKCVDQYLADLFNQKIYSKNDNISNRSEREIKGLVKKLQEVDYARLESFKAVAEKSRAARVLAKAEKNQQEARDEYLHAYWAAKSLALIREFETRYADNDPDGYIPKLASLKSQMEHQEYLDSHAHADTAGKLAEFIAKYENNDPDGLVQDGRNRLPQMQKQERTERDRLDREMIAEQKRKELDSLASRIVWCNRQTSSAYQAIDREREIAQVSGYENKLLMRQAGEIIVSCRNSVRRDFDDYRKKGGSRSLAELK